MNLAGEWVEEPSVAEAQRRIRADRTWIAEQQGLISHGRVLAILDRPRRSGREIVRLIERFHAVCVFAPTSASSRFDPALAQAGYDCHPCYHFEGGQDVMARSAKISASLGLTKGFEVATLDGNTGPGVIRAVQELYISGGLLAPPGYFLRGHEDPVYALAIVAHAGHVVGSGAVQDFSSGGRQYSRLAYLGPICMHPDVRRKGLASWITAKLVSESHQRFGATSIWANAECDNVAAAAMLGSVGMQQSRQLGMLIVLRQPSRQPVGVPTIVDGCLRK